MFFPASYLQSRSFPITTLSEKFGHWLFAKSHTVVCMESLWFKLILPLILGSEQVSLFTSINEWLTSNEAWRQKTNSNRPRLREWYEHSHLLCCSICRAKQRSRADELKLIFFLCKLYFPALKKTADLREHPWYDDAEADAGPSAICDGVRCSHTHNWTIHKIWPPKVK